MDLKNYDNEMWNDFFCNYEVSLVKVNGTEMFFTPFEISSEDVPMWMYTSPLQMSKEPVTDWNRHNTDYKVVGTLISETLPKQSPNPGESETITDMEFLYELYHAIDERQNNMDWWKGICQELRESICKSEGLSGTDEFDNLGTERQRDIRRAHPVVKKYYIDKVYYGADRKMFGDMAWTFCDMDDTGAFDRCSLVKSLNEFAGEEREEWDTLAEDNTMTCFLVEERETLLDSERMEVTSVHNVIERYAMAPDWDVVKEHTDDRIDGIVW